MSQTHATPETGQKPKRHFLMHPAVFIVEAVILVCVIVGITMANDPGENHYVGTATVDKVLGGGKKCWVDLTTVDGGKLTYFRMSKDTCDQVHEGDVIEVVKGKYLPQIASKTP